MFRSIRGKLFVTLLLASVMVVAGMYYFMRVSFERGFQNLVEVRQHKHLETLANALTAHYQAHQNWQTLATDKRQWVELLLQTAGHGHQPPWLRGVLAGPEQNWPPHRANRPEPLPGLHHLPPHDLPFPMPLELRVRLLDAQKQPIYGRADEVPKLALHPIAVAGQTVGYLGVLPGKPLHQHGDLQFMEQQAQALVWIALAMVLLSAALALLIAYVFGKPLKQITAASQALAVGQFDTRLPVESNDELGQLARDFNVLAAALGQAEQARKRWVADISHELRTPLSVLRGELEALQDGVRPFDRAAVDSLYADLMRLSRLADDLYQLALCDQGTLSYRKTDLDPMAILRQDVQAFAGDYQRQDIALTLHIPLGKPVLVYADADRLSQLFRNLLSNSLHYTDPGGQLHISMSKTTTELQLVFADSAPGVPEAALPKLFERFYRVEASRSRCSGGAGLGLAICHNIVTAHQGIITAAAAALGGLKITVTLPLST